MRHPTRLFLLAVLSASVAAACSPPGLPSRVLLIPTGEIEPVEDARLMRQINQALDEMGFSAEVDPDGMPALDPAEARKRARKEEAAHAVVIELSTAQERPGALPGSHLYVASATAHVLNEDPEHPATPPVTVEFVREDTSAAGLASSVVVTWADALAPHIADTVAHSAQMDKVFAGEADASALAAAAKMRPYEDFLHARHEEVAAYEAYCRAEGERVRQLSEAEGVRCVGNPCGQYALVGVSSAGRPVIEDLSRVPMFGVPLERDAHWLEPPERLFVLEADGTERDLMRSANFYGIATMRGTGDVITAETFTSEGNSALWGLSAADGAKQRLVLLGKGERNTVSEISPDGSMAFWCLRRGGGCFVQGDGGPKAEIPGLSWARWVAAGAGGQQRLVGELVDQGGVVIVDPASPQAPVRAKVKGRLREVVGASADRISIIARDDGGRCSLLHLSPTSGRTAAQSPMPLCIADATLLPDGRLVGTAVASREGDVPGDAEVVTWAPGQEAPAVLTSGGFHEEIVYPTADGQRVFFNRRLEAPEHNRFDTRVYRRMVCEVDVPPAQ